MFKTAKTILVGEDNSTALRNMSSSPNRKSDIMSQNNDMSPITILETEESEKPFRKSVEK